MTTGRHPGDWLILLLLVLFWGSSFALTKIAVAGIPPLWVMALRLIIAAVILYAMMRYEGLRLPVDRNTLIWFTWLGAIGSILPFFLISWGAQHLASGLVGVTMALMPLATITLAHFLLPDEPVTAPKAIGFIIGFSGLILLAGPQILGDLSFSGLQSVAQIAIILAAISYALQAVTARRSPDMHPLQKSTGVIIASAVGGVVIAILFAPSGLGPIPPYPLVSILALGIFPTAIAALLLFRLIDRTDASFVSVTNYLIPPFAYFLGIFALDEPFELRALAGLAVILAGIFIAERDNSANKNTAKDRDREPVD